MNTKTIAEASDCALDGNGLDLEKLLREGYYNCPTLAGKDSGVGNIIRK